MSDGSPPPGGSMPIIVPADVRAAFGPLIDLIIASESMNDDERRYWIDILPVMAPEQVTKLNDILVREHDQLAAIDAKYATDMAAIANSASVQQIGDERRERHQERSLTEASVKAKEDQAARDLLDQMQQL